MHRIAHSLYVRVRALFAVIGNCYKKLSGVDVTDFSAPRICPFCGLITPLAEGMLFGVRKGVEAGVMVRAGSFASASESWRTTLRSEL